MANQVSVLLALLNALLWGIAPVLFKKSYAKLPPMVSYVLDGLIGGTLIMLPYALFSNKVNYGYLPHSIFLTTLYSLTYLMFLFAFSLGKVGIVSILIEINPVFTLLFGLLFFNEVLTAPQILIILLILLLSIKLGAITEKAKIMQFKKYLTKPWFLFSVLTAVLIGIGDNLLNKSADLYNNYTTTLAIYLSQLIIIVLFIIFRKNDFFSHYKKTINHKKLLFPILLGSVCMNIGAVAFYVAFEKGSAPIVSAVSGISPIFTLVLSYFVLKEKLLKSQIFLIGIILFLVYLLGQ